MAAPTQTLVLAGIILLNFVLAAAALYRRIRGRRRPRQHVPPPPPLEPAAAEEAEAEEEEEEGGGGERRQSQRRRRRARRKRQQQEEGAASEGGGGDGADGAAAKATGKEELLPRRPQFPLASVAGVLQRRIHARYDDLARASEAQCLTIEQGAILLGECSSKILHSRSLQFSSVGTKHCIPFLDRLEVNEFLNCLVDARNELLQRYENVQRSFKIKKAMLSNHRNYRTSYDRLFEQVRRLETESDSLKKDAAIYNFVQERLQKSAPYKMIMELSAMELEAQEISFEELLAREKEDTAFWQRNGKMRSVSSK
ncbi:hypothetical protein ZEAMMB73_Zm00001d008858 [Zea mays]|uniref:Uncharacterized protein n=2 Tax=Zea mays TaxID=4577 RepID=A0A1D6FGE3_MAIZE|nr:hypothetical protein ZEAMMB73_Zm00001d008858 [Zea mays]